MSGSLTDVLEGWDGLGVLLRYDAPSGTWIFVALHDDTLGAPTGGCRLMTYATPAAALRDATRLAAGMTSKFAAMELPLGGGKSVLAVPGPLSAAARRGLFERFGDLLNSLAGRYRVGADLGTTSDDMAVLASRCGYVMTGGGGDDGKPRDPSPFTAQGVFAAIRSVARRTFESDDLRGRRVLVQGLGAVGGRLARMLSEAGAELLVSDIDDGIAREAAQAMGAELVPAESVFDTHCEIFAPCATGAVLDEHSIPRLRCRAVAGAANNQLAVAEDGERMRAAGILYAPDYVANGGGAMAISLMHLGVTDPEALRARVDGIGAALDDIFDEAASARVTPEAAAGARVQQLLVDVRAGRRSVQA